MNSHLTRFVLLVLLAAVCLSAGAYGLKEIGWMNDLPTYLFQIVLVLALATIFIFYRLQKISNEDPDRFITVYLGSIVAKLLLGSAMLLAIVLADEKSAFGNVSVFMAGYLAFTALEVVFLMRQKNRN